MPKSITQYSLLISCPGDIQSEITVIEKVVAAFNERYSDHLGISILTKHWHKSSYAQSGDKPQKLLNKQFVKDCDAAVALFGTRFGTPTDEYGSGTEEEIEIMLEAGKQVFMYFSDKAISPSQINQTEYARVLAFRERYKERGIYFTYSSDEDFSKLFGAHLDQYFLSLEKVNELKNERAPRLSLLGIDSNGKLSNNVIIESFTLNSEQSIQGYTEQIMQLYNHIAQIHFKEKTGIYSNALANPHGIVNPLYRKVEIENHQKELINQMAESLHIPLSEGFFELGDLSENKLASSFSGLYLEGTQQEKQKYDLIESLYFTIKKLLNWAQIENAFSRFKCLKLAIENSGTAIDEDIEVTIWLDKGALLSLDQFPTLDNLVMGYMIDKCDMPILFGIPSTLHYMEYSEAMNYSPSPESASPSSYINGYEEDRSEDYWDMLEDIFCYTVYSDEQHDIIKLKFDYIKHHTAIAFPTGILLKRIPNTVQYEITSRNCADIIRGKLI